MGKAARSRKHADKMRRKRQFKAARKAAYAALAGTGKKKAKSGNKDEGVATFKHAHLVTNCGNPGCRRCFPRVTVNDVYHNKTHAA